MPHTDHPDGVSAVLITTSKIELPIDIKTCTATLNVDITAQTVGKIAISIAAADITGNIPIDIAAQAVGNIGIDIKAQTVAQLNVNIAASAITVNVDITAQTLAQLNVNLAASAITLNVNISSQTANINVNLAASAITLNVNISSQSANISVNLAASAITLNVNISSQSANINVNLAASAATVTVSVTGTANISINAQTVGISLKPDWELSQGHDVFLHASGVTAVDAEQHENYAVDAGKTLYITNMSVCIFASNVADRDANHHNFAAYIAYNGTWLEEIGGDGGGSWHFNVPIVIPGGNTATLFCYNRSNHECTIFVTARGYIL